MQRLAVVLIPALISLLLLTACQTLPINGKLPDGLAAEKIVSVSKGAAFSLSPDGNLVAIGGDGLKLFHLPSKEYIALGKSSPSKLAWSPFGYSLAAIYEKDGASSIVIYDQYGTQTAESQVDTVLTGIGWLSEDELLAGGYRIKSFKFGSNYQNFFFSWKPGRNVPTESSLRDTTLLPATFAQWKPLLERGPMLDFTVQSGALLYLQPVAPPVFTPYYKLIIRDLASGKELEVASVGLNSTGGRFSADGEKILYSDGAGVILLYNPWSEELLHKSSSSGSKPALSPEGENWFADGTFFRREGVPVPLAEEAEANFSTDGSRIIIRSGGALYLLSGLKPAAGTLYVPAVAEKIAQLRSMRVQGLITAKEYKESLQKVTAQ